MEMIYQVVGKKIGEFEDKDTKQKISFGKLFCITVDCQEKGVEGEKAETFSVKPELLKTVEIGDCIKVFFNRFGKVEILQIV